MTESEIEMIGKRLVEAGFPAMDSDRLAELYANGAALAGRGVRFFTPARGLSGTERSAMRLGHADAMRSGEAIR